MVLHSLFEEQITAERELARPVAHQGTESYAEALSYFPELRSYGMGPDAYLEHIRKAKQAVSMPVIGSLNGVSTEAGYVRAAD